MTELSVYDSTESCREHLELLRREGRNIGLVPTMGALHAGHISLIRAARETCNVVVVWIFVNPTQFAPGEDFDKYPRPLERDLDICRETGVDVVLTPSAESMYPPEFQTDVEVRNLSLPWEGRHRPSHFRGVTTIVLKMFNIVQPRIAFFGQKDYQQQAIIRRMCLDLNVPVSIRTCATIRDPDGLALSSRNQYLSAEERQTALKLSAALRASVKHAAARESPLQVVRKQLNDAVAAEPGLELDYASIVDSDTLEEIETYGERMVAIVAATVGTTRLIDNMLIPPFTLEQLNNDD